MSYKNLVSEVNQQCYQLTTRIGLDGMRVLRKAPFSRFMKLVFLSYVFIRVIKYGLHWLQQALMLIAVIYN